MTLLEMTNFLESGAFYRQKDFWYLFWSPLKPLQLSEAPLPSDMVGVCHSSFFIQNPNQVTVQNYQFHIQLKTFEFLNLLNLFDTVEIQKHFPFSFTGDDITAFAGFEQDFIKIQTAIAAGFVQKAVPFIEEIWRGQPSVECRAYFLKQLIQTPIHLYPYGYWHEHQGLIGCTPEILFEVNSSYQFRTAAVAGTTAKLNDRPLKNLLEDPKELKEHMIVVDFLKASLQQWGMVQSSGPYIVDFPLLQHLKTDIDLTLQKSEPIWTWLSLLHPTSALGVFPRQKKQLEWLQTLNQQLDRGFFGTPLTFVQKEKVLSLVGIRCLQWSKGLSKICSGCGVIQQSDLNKEWLELLQKRMSVKKMLGWVDDKYRSL